MRNDIFVSRKSVHIKLPKELHAILRQKLFKHNLTMQDMFEEYSSILVEDSQRSDKNIQRVVTKKMKAIMEGKGRKKERKELIMGELDSDTLYNLLEETERHNDEE